MDIIGIDTGGTYTDFIYKDKGRWQVYKCPSTPHNPAEAVLSGIQTISDGKQVQVVHGSTVATNCILEKKGARTALVTNKGFEDVIDIGRQNRKNLYDLWYQKEAPLVPDDLRIGIRGRINCLGDVVSDLSDEDLAGLAQRLRNARVEAVAISFLFSFLNPDHEKRIGDALSELDVPLSLSHEILSEFREYERMSTTIINAYVSPVMKTYLEHLSHKIGSDNLRIMQSNGGSITAETAMLQPVRTVLSGPAGGVAGAFEIGKQAGAHKLITFDMGGTSTDVSLMDGDLPLTMESAIGRYPVRIPMIDIHTVGAGGGSIASIDAGAAMTVGPESAGADPGPVCCGKGEEITVTDANLFLGRLIPEYFLGGTLDTARLDFYMDKLSKAAGLSRVAAAEGVLAVANTAMERAIRVISVEKGYNPGEFILFSFGGAGGMHAAFLAKLLNMEKILIPRHPGIFSALGMLTSDVIKDYSRTIMLQDPSDMADIIKLFTSMTARGREDLGAQGVSPDRMTLTRFLDMRYKGQSYELMVPFGDHVLEQFHLLHKKRYGYASRNTPVEVVNIRLRARGKREKPVFEKIDMSSEKSCEQAVLGYKEVIFEGRRIETVLLARELLKGGQEMKGPALIIEYSATTVIPPFASGAVDAYGNIVVTIHPQGAS